MLDLTTIQDALGYGGWTLTPMQGDASTRRFARLTHSSGRKAVMMHTPADQADSQTAFESMAAYLLKADLSAPKTLARDPNNGILIVEDLGDTDVNKAIANGADETLIYTAIADLLVRFSEHSGPDHLAKLTPAVAAEMLDPFFMHFAPHTPKQTRTDIQNAIRSRFADMITPTTLSLRDFHSENLIWRPELTGLDRLGLVDFQDAVRAPAEYDLASLLWDARRDVSPAIRTMVMSRFAKATGRDVESVTANAHLISVQRNLRILGIFARLAKVCGKPTYLDLVPRVRTHVSTALEHPSLKSLHALLKPALDLPSYAST